MTPVDLAAIRFEIEQRGGPEGGPTLRVRSRSDGRELLRFDCFRRGAHWHRDPSGRDQRSPMPGDADALDWSLAELHRDLPGLLASAGFTPEAPFAPAELAEALERVEAALRNPPIDLDALELECLRRSAGEKWRTYPEDVLPLWVADMDFPAAEPIRRVLHRAVDRTDLGYPIHPAPTDLPQIVAERMQRRFGWSVEPRRVELLTDVMQGIHVAIDRFSEAGQGVVVQTPIYPPFVGAVRETRRRLVENPLCPGPDGLRVDLDGLAAAIDADTRLLLLCNPHNPSGRVFSREELQGIAELADRHDLIVVSDEIHADLVFRGARHLPFASLSPEAERRSITLTSASKAFNIAGLRCAVAIFGSDALRRRFLSLPRHLRGGLGILGIEATRAAWRHADPWLEQVRVYLEANRDFVVRTLAEQMPELRCRAPEATYLAWIDCRDLALEPSPYRFFLDRARVALSDGAAFGTPGKGFVRINFATSRAILGEALERMSKALRAAR